MSAILGEGTPDLIRLVLRNCHPNSITLGQLTEYVRTEAAGRGHDKPSRTEVAQALHRLQAADEVASDQHARSSGGARRYWTRAPAPAPADATPNKGGRPRSAMEERVQVRMTLEQRKAWRRLATELDLDLGGVMRVGAAVLSRLASRTAAAGAVDAREMSEDELVAFIVEGTQ